ncbi:hypothetical protein Bca52824_065662 [Brassica carinata]|uniref:Uncharacterized protein n=1 Tax=Brassica carinata TaxID=52824 RepID=A0A8X7QKN7_BRACI|nr:hypothetical protein Bca52824_065662 [Brassica carinata]
MANNDERRSLFGVSSRENSSSVGGGAVQTGTSSRGTTILRRAPGFSFHDKVDFHYEGPAPLVREEPTLPIENPLTVLEEGVPGRGARVDGNNVPVLVLSDTSVEGRDSPPLEESRRDGEENTGEVSEDAAVQVSPIARESSVRASELSALNDRESDREA